MATRTTTAHDEAPACAITRAGASGVTTAATTAQEGTTIMSNPISTTTATVPAPRHPDWCSPSHCERTGTDVLHCSVPTQRTTRDAHYALALVAPDEDDFPAQRSGPPELALTVESATVVGAPVGVYLGVDELPGLIAELSAHYHRAVAAIVNGCLSCGAPVYGDIFCAACRERVGRMTR
jgi:hypothetical protein